VEIGARTYYLSAKPASEAGQKDRRPPKLKFFNQTKKTKLK